MRRMDLSREPAGIDGFVSVADSPSLNPTDQLTIAYFPQRVRGGRWMFFVLG
jgi:hypothetical protein